VLLHVLPASTMFGCSGCEKNPGLVDGSFSAVAAIWDELTSLT
jgi:hypothetical protein